jgi:hypothetical protein
MTLQRGRSAAGWARTTPESTPRLRLKPKAAPTGYVDGAWWPHTDDLSTELPDLLAVLSVRLGAIDRVVYNLSEWAEAPARLATHERAVRLSGYSHQPANTLEVLGVNRNKVVLLVVPTQSDPVNAHDAMMTAATPKNASTVDVLLATCAQDAETRTRTRATE